MGGDSSACADGRLISKRELAEVQATVADARAGFRGMKNPLDTRVGHGIKQFFPTGLILVIGKSLFPDPAGTSSRQSPFSRMPIEFSDTFIRTRGHSRLDFSSG